MKILRLNLKNINSLQGENRLDFNQSPLLDAGVFAITGPNGSGKSSILDAITLALYGETFKFDRPAEHVMTRHTAECYAEIEFRVHDTDYRSLWQVAREHNQAEAALLSANMSLTRLGETEEVLANDPAKVRAMVAQILGLDFRSFTRSTLLAQGDFAAFLNALDSERLDILERILSTDIYSEYKQQAVAQAAQQQATLSSLQADLLTIPLLDAASQEAREHDLNDFNDQLKSLTQSAQDLDQQLQRLQAIAEIDTQLQQDTFKKQVLQQKTQQLATDLQRIGNYSGIAELHNQMGVIDSQQTLHSEHQNTLTHYREELALLQAELAKVGEQGQVSGLDSNKEVSEQLELIADLAFQTEQLNAERSSTKASIQLLEQQLIDKQAEAITVKSWIEQHAQEANLLDGFPDIGQLKKLTLQIADHKRQHKAFLKDSKVSVAQQKNQQADLERLSKQVPALQSQLVEYEAKLRELLNNHTLEELEALRVDQHEKVNDFKELIALSKIQDRFKDSLLVRLGLVKQPEVLDINEATREIDSLQNRLLTEDNIRKALEQAVFNESMLRKLQAERLHLVKNEPCFLCGSLKHPYLENPPTVSDSKQALADQNKRIQNINTAIAKLQQQLKLAQKDQEKRQQKSDRLLRVQSEWLTLCNRLNIAASDIQIDKLGPIKKLLSTHTVELKDIERILKDVKQYQKKIAAVTELIVAQTAALSNVQALMFEDNQGQNTPLRNSQSLEQELTKLVAEEKALAEKVSLQLTQLGEKFPGKGKEDALFDRLNKRRQTYQTNVLRGKNIQEEVITLQAKITSSQAELLSFTSRLEDYSAKLNKEQSIGVHLAVIEKQKLIQQQEITLSQLSTQLQTAQQAILAQANPFGIQHFTELADLFQLLPQQTSLLAQQQELSEAEQQLGQSVQALFEQKQALQAELSSQKSLEVCKVELHSVHEQIEINQHEIQRLEELLTVQANRLDKFTQLQAKIAEQQQLVLAAQLELQNLDADNGHAFRRKVQRKTADKLLTKTNQILEKISGRFYVRQGDNDQGLKLEVEDTYQQNTHRLPKTLSGGESFVVSLALALGLSELASNGHSIESLFLDEGFGNLDAEALVTIVSTLEALQTQGKKVGVISHVDGVRKRIKTQIEMRKRPDGFSEFKLLM